MAHTKRTIEKNIKWTFITNERVKIPNLPGDPWNSAPSKSK